MTFLTDQTKPTYREMVQSLLGTKGNLKIAVAFWGLDSAELMEAVQSKAQILCNLESGATNPKAIKAIMERHEVKTLSNLHAKVLWSRTAAIVGSANLSANGLNFEDGEVAGWREAGFKIEQADQLKIIERWFESLWQIAARIDDSKLKHAEDLWKKRRNERIGAPQKADSLHNCLASDPEYFRDRKAYLTMTIGGDPSPEIEAADKADTKSSGSNISSFEGWEELPEDSELICFYYDPKSDAKPELDGLWISLNQTRISGKSRIACRKAKSICEYKISTKDKKFIASKIPELWRHAIGDRTGKFIDLFKVAKLLSRKNP